MRDKVGRGGIGPSEDFGSPPSQRSRSGRQLQDAGHQRDHDRGAVIATIHVGLLRGDE